MTCPLQSGNPRHALAAPRFAVSAPKRTVTNPRTRATILTNPGREPGVIGDSVFPGLAPGVSFAARISVASKSIAVPRWRITVHGGRLSFTVIAPSRTCTTSSPHATVPVLDDGREVERREQLAVAERPMLAAAQPRSGDPDDGAEDDEQVGEGRRGPGEARETSRHGCGNVWSGRGRDHRG